MVIDLMNPTVGVVIDDGPYGSSTGLGGGVPDNGLVYPGLWQMQTSGVRIYLTTHCRSGARQ
jgi:hypothetical protein